MKKKDFLALPEGTIVLLRPVGFGSRDYDAHRELILARLGSTQRLSPGSGWNQDPGAPMGFRAQPHGEHRAVALLRSLPKGTPEDGDEHWRENRGRVRVAEVARNVVGVWDDLKDSVLTERRDHFAKMEASAQKSRERAAARQATLDEALTVVRPAMTAAHLDSEHHRALSTTARPGERTFTTEEVARLVTSLKDQA